jgi:hypothetical protein
MWLRIFSVFRVPVLLSSFSWYPPILSINNTAGGTNWGANVFPFPRPGVFTCQKILVETLDKFPEPKGEVYLSRLETSIFWQIPLTSMVYFYNSTLQKHCSIMKQPPCFSINSTLYKNAGFSLDKSYAIFSQILWFSPIFPSPWYFFPDFKSKSQNIWQQIILFSRTVMQMIYAYFLFEIFICFTLWHWWWFSKYSSWFFKFVR